MCHISFKTIKFYLMLTPQASLFLFSGRRFRIQLPSVAICWINAIIRFRLKNSGNERRYSLNFHEDAVLRAKATVIKCENAHVNTKELCIQEKHKLISKMSPFRFSLKQNCKRRRISRSGSLNETWRQTGLAVPHTDKTLSLIFTCTSELLRSKKQWYSWVALFTQHCSSHFKRNQLYLMDVSFTTRSICLIYHQHIAT